MIQTVKIMKNVTHMITYANQFAFMIVGLIAQRKGRKMNSAITTQSCVYIVVTKTVIVKEKIISVTSMILYADQGALPVKIARNLT